MHLQDPSWKRIKGHGKKKCNLFFRLFVSLCMPPPPPPHRGYSPLLRSQASKQGQHRGRLRIRAADGGGSSAPWSKSKEEEQEQLDRGCSFNPPLSLSLPWLLSFPCSLHHEVNLIYQLCSGRAGACVWRNPPDAARLASRPATDTRAGFSQRRSQS